MSRTLTLGNVQITSLTDSDGPFPLKLNEIFPGDGMNGNERAARYSAGAREGRRVAGSERLF